MCSHPSSGGASYFRVVRAGVVRLGPERGNGNDRGKG